MFVEKVIRALKDFGLRTYYGSHSLVAGEEKRIRFRNQRGFEALLRMGNLIEIGPGDDIPVIVPNGAEPADMVDLPGKFEKESQGLTTIVPEVTEDTIVGIEPIDKIDSSEDIDPGKPDLPNPEETPNPTVEELEAALKQKGGSIEVLPNGEIQAKELPIEELTPEQETEGLPEVEEIPIEKQDESKPVVLKLSDVIDKP